METPFESVQLRRKAKDRDGLYKRRDYWHYELIVDGRKRSFTSGTKDYNQAKRIRAAALRDVQQGKVPIDSGRKRQENGSTTAEMPPPPFHLQR